MFLFFIFLYFKEKVLDNIEFKKICVYLLDAVPLDFLSLLLVFTTYGDEKPLCATRVGKRKSSHLECEQNKGEDCGPGLNWTESFINNWYKHISKGLLT